MKLTLTDDNGVVLDQWDSEDELDLGVFYTLSRSDDVPPVTQQKLKAEYDNQCKHLT